uniref:Uncharacterized protein n=1 Tax=Trichuris muris TaxID=70415 RepID=A0A5S6QY59_TRIMR
MDKRRPVEPSLGTSPLGQAHFHGAPSIADNERASKRLQKLFDVTAVCSPSARGAGNNNNRSEESELIVFHVFCIHRCEGAPRSVRPCLATVRGAGDRPPVGDAVTAPVVSNCPHLFKQAAASNYFGQKGQSPQKWSAVNEEPGGKLRERSPPTDGPPSPERTANDASGSTKRRAKDRALASRPAGTGRPLAERLRRQRGNLHTHVTFTFLVPNFWREGCKRVPAPAKFGEQMAHVSATAKGSPITRETTTKKNKNS